METTQTALQQEVLNEKRLLNHLYEALKQANTTGEDTKNFKAYLDHVLLTDTALETNKRNQLYIDAMKYHDYLQDVTRGLGDTHQFIIQITHHMVNIMAHLTNDVLKKETYLFEDADAIFERLEKYKDKQENENLAFILTTALLATKVRFYTMLMPY